MGAFEDFMVLEMSKRRALLKAGDETAYDGDPNDPSAPNELKLAPVGAWYLRVTPTRVYYTKTNSGATDWVESGSGGQASFVVDRTTANFSVAVNAGTGSDPTTPIRIRNQSDSDTWGAFTTVPAAIESLPDNILHEVSLQFPDGTFQLDSAFLGELNRFSFNIDGDYLGGTHGKIVFVSENGLVRESGTGNYAGSGSSTASQIVLAADPGFASNAHRGKFINIVSGTGAGQRKAIRNHATTTFNVAGAFSPVPDVTSVVEILVPAAEIVTASGAFFVNLATKMQSGEFANVVFSSLDLRSSNVFGSMFVHGAHLLLEGGARVLHFGISALEDSTINLSECVIDTDELWKCLIMQGALLKCASPGNASWLLRSGQGAGIAASPGPSGKLPFLALRGGGAIDDTVAYFSELGSAVRVNSGCPAMMVTGVLHGSGNAGYGVEMFSGGYIVDVGSDYFSDPLVVTGVTGDLSIDGVVKTWADLNAAVDQTLAGSTSWIRWS